MSVEADIALLQANLKNTAVHLERLWDKTQQEIRDDLQRNRHVIDAFSRVLSGLEDRIESLEAPPETSSLSEVTVSTALRALVRSYLAP